MAHVLVLAAHPDLRLSRVNRALLDAARGLAAAPDGKAAGEVEVRDLYALYPDYLIDVQAEQAACARADLIVWQHPIQWYAMPPLMKLWLDEVLTLGWAYGRTREGVEGRALAGKDVWLVTSTGGQESAYSPQGYNRYFFDAFLPPFEQTAVLCHMRFLPPLVLHGAHRASAEEVQAHAAVYRDKLASYPDWPELEDMDACPECVLPEQDRPEEVGA